jgi:hypothetical protein
MIAPRQRGTRARRSGELVASRRLRSLRLMNVTSADLRRQRSALSVGARLAIRRSVRKAPHVDVALAQAVASRETGMRNIAGDGGHGRGIVQIDDRFHGDWLGSVRGCRSGSSIPVFRSARPAGRVPTISAGLAYGVAMLEANVAECKRRGVHEGHRMSVAISGYNAGITGAINAYMAHGRTPAAADRATTGGDYAADVIARARVLRGN